MIDWAKTQRNLNAAGYPTGINDGKPGRMTYTAIFAHATRAQPGAVLRAIGTQAALTLPMYRIDASPDRLAEFVAQTGNETGGFATFEENLRYSAKRLMAIWPSRFPTFTSALPYAWDTSDADREDEALANLVYGKRMGNERNGTNDNDGWDNRGRGMLQHTGKAEYDQLLASVGLRPDEVADPAKSVIAAADYWARAKVNDFVDRGDYRGARRAVNGGYIGLEEVTHLRLRTRSILA